MNPHADSVQQPSDHEVFDAMPAHHQARTSHENIRDVRDALARFGTRPAAEPEMAEYWHKIADERAAEIVRLTAEPSQSGSAVDFEQWWLAEVAANGGAPIGADYKHWAKAGFELRGDARAPAAPAEADPAGDNPWHDPTPAGGRQSERPACSLGCTTTCKAREHGCASECPALPNQPPFERPAPAGQAVGEDERAELARLRALINTPHTDDWMRAVDLEAAHQQERWGVEHDAGKEPHDWFWLLGYLSGKALAAFTKGDREKGMHHIVSSGAVLLNWHRNVTGWSKAMRPGIAPPAALAASQAERPAVKEDGK